MSELVFPLSLITSLAFPWQPFRYLLPLTPFVLFYLVMAFHARQELSRLWKGRPGRAASWVAPGLVVGCLVALDIYSNARFILRKHSTVQAERPEWIRIFEEHEALFAWIRDNIRDQTTFIVQNPPLLYLYTGEKTMPAANAAMRRDVWERQRVRYLVQMGVPPPPPPNAAELRFPMPYRSHAALDLRVVDLGDPSRRSTPGAR